MNGFTWKRLAGFAQILLLGGSSLTLTTCEKEDITSILNIFVTDSPIDADTVKSVNIAVSDIEWRQNDKWESVRYIEDPISVDVLSLTNGEVFALVNQNTVPGKYSALRLTLQFATKDGSLIMNPRSNIEFIDGSINYLYWYNDEPTQITIESNIEISTRSLAQFVIDFDLRKSIHQDASGDYIIEPAVRLVDASKAGAIDVTLANNLSQHVVAYVYRGNTFSDSELNAPSESVAFKNAVTSGRVGKNNKLLIAFLEEGEYELIFVENDEEGQAMNILTRHPGVQIKLRELNKFKVNF